MEKRMRILNKLASSLDRRDELPNQELAKEIVLQQDEEAVKILVEHLSAKKAIQNDCIKVLYEIGEQRPELIADYIQEFITALTSSNNRLQWGAMTALCTITKLRPEAINNQLGEILAAADKGSVITRDNAVKILISLCSFEQYSENAFILLVEQLLKCPTNQLPMYAELASAIVGDKDKSRFVEVLSSRLDDIEKTSKWKRVEKVIAIFN